MPTADTPPPTAAPSAPSAPAPRPSAWGVLAAFLRLGVSAFGGPVAHIGYFRTEFVERRRWLDERGFTDLLALCQFLPGPASSQLGIAIGLVRAGVAGSVAAWVGFTLPSALLMIAFAYGLRHVGGLAGSPALQGLKVVAVAVVAQAVWGMARTLCPDRPRAALALAAALVSLAVPGVGGQLATLAVAALVGIVALRAPPAQAAAVHAPYGVSRRAGVLALGTLGLLLVGLPLAARLGTDPAWRLVDGFFRAGALVFGGGHVVLPLLQAVVEPGGAVSHGDFIAGYGAAQAVPGPLFTLAAFLGAVMSGPWTGWRGGLLALFAIFLPAYLLVVGALPFWDALRRRPRVRDALAGVNAAVVGLLLAALYDPVWTGAIHSRADFGLALGTFGLLVVAGAPPPLVVALAAAASALLARG